MSDRLLDQALDIIADLEEELDDVLSSGHTVFHKRSEPLVVRIEAFKERLNDARQRKGQRVSLQD